MREFKSIDWYKIRGKPVVTVILDKDEPKDTMREVFQRDGIKIDGIERQVIGVEAWALQTIRAGQVIGLMLEPLPDQVSESQKCT